MSRALASAWVLVASAALAADFTGVPTAALIGDGVQSVSLGLSGVTLAPVVSAEAGTVSVRPGDGPGVYAVTFVTPTVAAARNVMLTATLGKRTVATATLRVVAPRPARPAVESQGPLKLKAPGYVTLGREASVEVSFAAEGGVVPRLSSTVGSMSAARPGEAGRFTATLTLPGDVLPKVAVVYAVAADGALVDLLAIPLYGLAEVVAKTDADAEVRVTLGPNTYGPFRADRKGRVVAAVEVPPGTQEFSTVARRGAGAERVRKTKLPVPPFPRAIVVCPQSADRVTIVTVDESGAPAGTPPKLVAKGAFVDAPVALRPGLYDAPLRFAPDAAFASAYAVSASVPGSKLASTCSGQVPGGPASAVTVSLSAQRYVAGSGAGVSAEVKATDAQGNPARTAAPALLVDVGSVGTLTAVAPGHFRAQWTLADAFSGREQATMTAAFGAKGPRSSAGVALVPGALSKLSADVSPRAADGGHQVAVDARDEFGNAVAPEQVVAEGPGQVAAFTRGPGAHLSSRYVPRTPGESLVVRGAFNDISTTVRAGQAPRRLWRLGVGLGGGYASNFGKVQSPVGKLEVYLRPGWLNRRLALGVDVGFTSSQVAGVDPDSHQAVSTSVSVLPVVARGTWFFSEGDFEPFVGVGVGGAAVTRSWRSPTLGDVALAGAEPAGLVMAGVGWRLGPGRLVVELRGLGTSVQGPTRPEWLLIAVGMGGYRLEL